jgi:hypothetical protein
MVCATRHKFFFTRQVHKETWVDLAVKLWVSISCAGAISSVKHTRARNTKTNMWFDFFLEFHSGTTRLFGERGVFFYEQNKQQMFFLQKGLNIYNTT